eukprot:CAMPEP_0194049302 /NCGR_PEP_ID=MMETSP0009_2-20130614/30270_1 /TAXON_ID=210454 /ORGANISM="Grammatophora oceanica, Strain CCMP 410" /LENGTH=117 /DNA_ID=CAMNT_0038695421 /DNA_START=57 /DNA_END=410 /DNA_ORIENTATION=+
MSIRSAAIRFPASRVLALSANQTRALSTQGHTAVQRLQEVMEDYRRTNFTREIPSRFKKEIVGAAKDENNKINIESMMLVVDNIGGSERVSRNDLERIFTEVGESGKIPADRMMQLL